MASGRTSNVRELSVRARISERVKNDLQAISDDYGMSMSGLIAFILGQWVHQQKVVLGPMLQEIGNTAKETVASSLKEQLELDDVLKD